MHGSPVPELLRSTLSATALAAALTLLPGPGSAEDMLGMTDMVTPDAPGAHVMTFVIDLAAGEEIPMHSHGGSGIVLVLEGEGTVTRLDGSTFAVKAGETFEEPAGDIHGAKISDAGPARMIWTIVLPDGAELEIPYSG